MTSPGKSEPLHPFLSGAWPWAILFIVSVLPYVGVLRNDFAYAYDDKAQILDNPCVHNIHLLGQTLTRPIWQILGAQPLAGYYRPVSTIAFLICYQLFGARAAGFHLLSLLLNAGVVLLLFGVAARLFTDRRAALAAATIYALLPVHVEVVAWISASMDLEMTLFYLLAFWCFLSLEDRNGARAFWMSAGMSVSYACALLSKEPAVTLPVLATLYEHFYRCDRAQTFWRQKLQRYGPMWLVCAGYALVRVKIFGEFAHPPGLHPLSLPHMFLSALALVGEYFGLLLLPIRLSALYVFQASTGIDGGVLIGAFIVLVSAVIFAILWKHMRPVSFPILWFFMTLAPVLDARWMGQYVLADRYLYLPSAGFCLLAGWAGVALWQMAERGSALRTAMTAAACLVAALCVLRISTRVLDWQNDITILSQASAMARGDYRIHDGMAQAYWLRGDASDAEREWRQTLQLDPTNAAALASLGAICAQEKRFDQAIPLLERSLALNPNNANAHLDLGAAYAETGKVDSAEEQFRAAIALSPMNFNAHNLLGKLYFDSQRFAEAAYQFHQSLGCEPNLAAYDHLGYISMQRHDYNQAEDDFRRALIMNSADSHAHYNLGLIYAATHRTDEAREELRAALAADPQNPEILSALEKLGTNH